MSNGGTPSGGGGTVSWDIDISTPAKRSSNAAVPARSAPNTVNPPPFRSPSASGRARVLSGMPTSTTMTTTTRAPEGVRRKAPPAAHPLQRKPVSRPPWVNSDDSVDGINREEGNQRSAGFVLAPSSTSSSLSPARTQGRGRGRGGAGGGRAPVLPSLGGGSTSPTPGSAQRSVPSPSGTVGAATGARAYGHGAGAGAGCGALTPAQGRPVAVARALQQHPTQTRTAKGRAIQEDLQALGEDYFGDVSSRAPVSDPRRIGESVGPAFTDELAKSKTFYTASGLSVGWTSGGPVDPAGRFFDASNSHLLCMDVWMPRGGGNSSGALGVVGSADHGLKVFDLSTLRERKTLYNKTFGHTEWVTSCRFFSDGRVLSGSMDSKLCLWDSVTGRAGGGGMARCQDLLGHTGSISQVDVNDHDRALSASYDRTLRVWDCSRGGGREVGVLAGHKAAVTQFDWGGTRVLSGDRQGQAKVWDLETADCLCTMATKRGQIGAVQQLAFPGDTDSGGSELTLFGDQGGVLTVLDLRQGKRPVHQGELHPGGVLSGIRGLYSSGGGSTGGAAVPLIATSGADKRICVLEPRRGFEALHCFTDHTDFIYSMETAGPLVLSGGGNGWLLVHDVRTGECMYGLGAGKNAVREIFAAPTFLVAAGDDGKAVVYDF